MARKSRVLRRSRTLISIHPCGRFRVVNIRLCTPWTRHNGPPRLKGLSFLFAIILDNSLHDLYTFEARRRNWVTWLVLSAADSTLLVINHHQGRHARRFGREWPKLIRRFLRWVARRCGSFTHRRHFIHLLCRGRGSPRSLCLGGHQHPSEHQ